MGFRQRPSWHAGPFGAPSTRSFLSRPICRDALRPSETFLAHAEMDASLKFNVPAYARAILSTDELIGKLLGPIIRRTAMTMTRWLRR